MQQDYAKKKHELLDFVNKNYRHTNSDFSRGFIQGLIASTTNHHSPTQNLLRRYITALTNLVKNKNISITSLDKGGGIAIIDIVD